MRFSFCCLSSAQNRSSNAWDFFEQSFFFLGAAVFDVVGLAGVDLLLCVGMLGWRGTAGTREVLPWELKDACAQQEEIT